MYAYIYGDIRKIKVSARKDDEKLGTNDYCMELSLNDFLKLTRCEGEWYTKYDEPNTLCAFYASERSDLYKVFTSIMESKEGDINKLLVKNSNVGLTKPEVNKEEVDMCSKFKYSCNGSSVLVYMPGKEKIFIAKRKKVDEYTSLERLLIDNNVRDTFFADSKRCSSYKKNGRYEICSRDSFFYTRWVKLIKDIYTKQYIKQYLEVNK